MRARSLICVLAMSALVVAWSPAVTRVTHHRDRAPRGAVMIHHRGNPDRGGRHRQAVRHTRVNGMSWAPHADLPPTQLPHLAPGVIVHSNDWSGYADVAGSKVQIRYVQANFTVPSIDCAKSTIGSSGYAYASHWVGLDGYDSTTVEQTGVSAYCTSTSGSPTYNAWYEMYPSAAVAFTGVSPGDAISASVYFDGSTYRLRLTDLTTGANVASTQGCPSGSTCKNSSAEVVTEDPGGAVAHGYDLADFGMSNFSNVVVTSLDGTRGALTGNPLWTTTDIEMVNGSGAVMAEPAALEGSQSFGVSWVSSS